MCCRRWGCKARRVRGDRDEDQGERGMAVPRRATMTGCTRSLVSDGRITCQLPAANLVVPARGLRALLRLAGRHNQRPKASLWGLAELTLRCHRSLPPATKAVELKACPPGHPWPAQEVGPPRDGRPCTWDLALDQRLLAASLRQALLRVQPVMASRMRCIAA